MVAGKYPGRVGVSRRYRKGLEAIQLDLALQIAWCIELSECLLDRDLPCCGCTDVNGGCWVGGGHSWSRIRERSFASYQRRTCVSRSSLTHSGSAATAPLRSTPTGRLIRARHPGNLQTGRASHPRYGRIGTRVFHWRQVDVEGGRSQERSSGHGAHRGWHRQLLRAGRDEMDVHPSVSQLRGKPDDPSRSRLGSGKRQDRFKSCRPRTFASFLLATCHPANVEDAKRRDSVPLGSVAAVEAPGRFGAWELSLIAFGTMRLDRPSKPTRIGLLAAVLLI